MSDYKIRAFLKDILEATHRITVYTKNMTYDAYLCSIEAFGQGISRKIFSSSINIRIYNFINSSRCP